jgi:putative transposase
VQLRAALEAGPAAYGREQDQRRPLARAAAPVLRLFGVSCPLRGVSCLLHRLGFSPQVPAHRAFERDEDAITAWRAATWAKVRG